ncbi:MAG: CvpA family protein [Dehalococcoidia bacterium]
MAAPAGTLSGVNPIDIVAVFLVIAFGYKGYRTGLVRVVLGLTGGLLAFGMAAVLAPLLAPLVTPLVSDRLGVPSVFVRAVLVVGLTMSLRFLLGFAVRELASVISLLIRAVPPLALADRLLGIVPSALVGVLLVLALVFIAVKLPSAVPGREQAEDSWVAQNLVNRPEDTVQRLRGLGERLLTRPPQVNSLVLGAGVAGLAVAAFSAGRLRGPASAATVREAPTRRIPPRAAMQETAEPLAWIRVTFGIGVALAMAAGLVFLSSAR